MLVPILCVIVTLVMHSQERTEPDTLQLFNPALCGSDPLSLNAPPLKIFPLHGDAFTIRLPFALGHVAYSPDGKALYGVAWSAEFGSGKPGVLKIEFNPVRATPVPDSDKLDIVSIAIPARKDKLVFSGQQKNGHVVQSGLFELDPKDGRTRVLVLNDKPASDYVGSWSHLSVSPDGKRAVAMRHRTLELIDLDRGVASALGTDLELGAWSPDGKWLAAFDWKKGKTILMDAHTLAPVRTLGQSDVEWSPDSRYLLGERRYDLCSPDAGTLQAINIENGKSITIWSSRCRVKQTTNGWISREVAK